MIKELYEKLRDHEKKTGRNLPFLIADDEEKRADLIDELLYVLGCDPRSAAHFLLEQMVMMHRIADHIYIGSAEGDSPEWENVDGVDTLVDNMSSLADDYMITAGYLLDMA